MPLKPAWPKDYEERVAALESGGASKHDTLAATGNKAGQWTEVSASDFQHTITAASHGKGQFPGVQFFEELSAGRFQPGTITIEIQNSGDVVLKATAAKAGYALIR